MSVSQASLLPRTLRPHLSVRYQVLLRRTQSSSTSRAVNPTATTNPPNFFRRNRSRLIWGTLALGLGLAVGQFVLHTVAPPPMPAVGSREDTLLLSDLNRRIDSEFKVKVLRGKCLGVAKQLRGEEGGWVELVSENEKPSNNGGKIIEVLQGAKGLGVERVFWNCGEKKLVAVIWLGGGLSGWPGVTHGGVLATALTEKTSLAQALAHDQFSTGISSAAAVPQRLPGTGQHAKMFLPETVGLPQPQHLDLTYKKPTYANNFYVIRVVPSSKEEDHPVPENSSSSPSSSSPLLGGAAWDATLETTDASVCVKSYAQYPPSSQLERVETAAVHVAKKSYAEFRKWLWPSRQEESQIG